MSPVIPLSELEARGIGSSGADPLSSIPEPRTESLFESLDRKTWRDAFSDAFEKPYKLVPFVNAVGLAETARVFKASRDSQKGIISPADDIFLNRFLADRQRDQSFGYKVWNMALNIVPYAFEFMAGGGLVKGGATAIAKAATTGATTKAATKSLVKVGALSRLERAGAATASKLFPKIKEGSAGFKIASLLSENTGGGLIASTKAFRKLRLAGESAEVVGQAKKVAFGASGRHLSQAAIGGVPRTLLQPHRITDAFIKNMTPEYALTPDQQGELTRMLMEEGDGLFKAFAHAFGDVYIENFSEQTGENLFLLRSLFGGNAKKIVGHAAVAKIFDKTTKKIQDSGFLAKMGGSAGSKLAIARQVAAKHLLGDFDNPGMLQQLGISSIIGEMGEEAIGGGLRQLTGISPFGLPEFEDVAAMAVGFALNPISIGHYANDTATGVLYGDRIREATQAFEKYKKSSPDVLKDVNSIGGARKHVSDFIKYFQGVESSGQESGMWDKFARFMWRDNVERKIMQKTFPSLSGDSIEFSSRALEAAARNTPLGEVDPTMIDNLIEFVSGTRAIDSSYSQTIRAAASVSVGEQFDKDANLRGFIRRGLETVSAPLVVVRKGALQDNDLESLQEMYPFLVNVVDIADLKAETQSEQFSKTEQHSFETVSATNPIDVGAITEDNVHKWGQLLGVDKVHGEHVFRDRVVLRLHNDGSRLAEVKRRASRLNEIAKAMPPGKKFKITPTLFIKGTVAQFRAEGQAMEGEDTDLIATNIGAHYSPKEGLIYVTPSSEFTDVAEDVLEMILSPENKEFAPDKTQQLIIDEIRKQLKAKNDTLAPNFSDLELLSKTIKVLRFGQPSGEGDLAFFVIKNGLRFAEKGKGVTAALVDGYLKDAATRAGFNPSVLESLSGAGAKYKGDNLFEHKGFSPQYFLGTDSGDDHDVFDEDSNPAAIHAAQTENTIIDYIGKVSPKNPDADFKSFSLVQSFDRERYGNPPETVRADGSTMTWKYLMEQFMEDPKVDHLNFIQMVVNQHGNDIKPYLVQFFKDLYRGEILVNGETPAKVPIAHVADAKVSARDSRKVDRPTKIPDRVDVTKPKARAKTPKAPDPVTEPKKPAETPPPKEEEVQEEETLSGFVAAMKEKYPELADLTMTRIDPLTVELKSIFIQEASQKKGIGSKVLKEITDYADRTGTRIVLEAASRIKGLSMEKLRAFYEAAGFTTHQGDLPADFPLESPHYEYIPEEQEPAVLDYSKLFKKDLKELLDERDIPYRANDLKPVLVSLLEEFDKKTTPEGEAVLSEEVQEELVQLADAAVDDLNIDLPEDMDWNIEHFSNAGSRIVVFETDRPDVLYDVGQVKEFLSDSRSDAEDIQAGMVEAQRLIDKAQRDLLAEHLPQEPAKLKAPIKAPDPALAKEETSASTSRDSAAGEEREVRLGRERERRRARAKEILATGRTKKRVENIERQGKLNFALKAPLKGSSMNPANFPSIPDADRAYQSASDVNDDRNEDPKTARDAAERVDVEGEARKDEIEEYMEKNLDSANMGSDSQAHGSEEEMERLIDSTKQIVGIMDDIAHDLFPDAGLEVGTRFLYNRTHGIQSHFDKEIADELDAIFEDLILGSENADIVYAAKRAQTIWKSTVLIPEGFWQYVFRNESLEDGIRGTNFPTSRRVNRSKTKIEYGQEVLNQSLYRQTGVTTDFYDGREFFFRDVNNKLRPGVVGMSWQLKKLIEYTKTKAQPFGTFRAVEGGRHEFEKFYQKESIGWFDGKRRSVKKFTPAVYRDISHYEFEKAIAEGSTHYWHYVGRFGEKDTFFQTEEKVLRGEELDEWIKEGGVYQQHYDNLSPDGQKIMVSPAALRKMSHYSQNEGIHLMRWGRRFYGSVDAFKSVEDYVKRSDKAGTPGIEVKGKVRKLVFNDYNLTDGAMFFDAETLGNLLGGELEGVYDPDDIHLAKIFMMGHNRNTPEPTTENGNKGHELILSKPLAFDIDELQKYPLYQKLKAFMTKYNVVLEAASAMKLRGGEEANAVQVVDLIRTDKNGIVYVDGEIDVMGVDEVGDLTDMIYEHDSEKGDMMIVTANPNDAKEAKVMSILKQMESISLFLPDRFIDGIVDLENWQVEAAINRILPYLRTMDTSESVQRMVPHGEEADYDRYRFDNLQLRLEQGQEFFAILNGMQQDLVKKIFASSIFNTVRVKYSRTVMSVTPPGSEKRDDVKKVKGHLQPMGFDANVPNAFYTQDSPEFATREDVVKHLEDGFNETFDQDQLGTNDLYPWMFDRGKNDIPNPKVLAHRVVEGVDGKYRIAGEPVIVSRIPMSSYAYGTHGRLDSRIGSTKYAGSMSNRKDSLRKGEDFDMDMHQIMTLTRSKGGQINTSPGEKGFRNRAMMLRFDGMEVYRKEIEEHVLNAPNLLEDEEINAYVAEQKLVEIQDAKERGKSSNPSTEYLEPSYNHQGEMGQMAAIRVTKDSKSGLAIIAGFAPVARYANRYKISFLQKDPIVLDAKNGVIVHRTKEHLENFDLDQQMAYDLMFNEFPIQLLVDDIKDPKTHYLGLNQHTAPIFAVLALSGVQHQTKDARKKHLMKIFRFLRTPMMKRYSRLMEETMHPGRHLTFENLEYPDLRTVRTVMEKLYGKEGENLIKVVKNHASEMQMFNTFLNRKHDPELTADKHMEAERITEYVKTGKGFRVLDTSNLTTKEGKFIQAFQTVDLIGDFMRSDVWGRDIVHAPMIESHIVEQYPEIHRLKPWDRDSVYNHAREVGRMMAFLNAASQGEPARIVGALGRVRELMDSRKENAFIKLISEVGLDNKGQPTDSYKLALTKIGRFLSVEDIGYQEKVDAFDDLKEEDQRTIIIYLLQEYGTSLSQMNGNFMQLIMATKMGAQLDLEIFHEIVRRWLPDRMNARQRQAVRDRLSGDVSGWFDYVPFRPILKTEVDPADLDALNEPERKILKTTNALNITHRTRKLEKGEKKVIPIKKDETPEQTTLIPEEGEEEEEEQTEEDESSVFNDADRKAQDDKKEDESVASAKAKLTEARKGVMQRNRDGYGLRNAYEIKHLLTEEEYQAEVLGGRDINPNQINSNSDSGRVMAAMDKGGEEAMPRHHFKSLFAEPGKGKEIDSIAMEAGFLGEQASLDFIAKAKEDSDLRQQREDLQFEEAEQGIYYDTQEERLQGEMEQRDVDNIAHFSLKGQAQDDLGFINLNSRLSTVLGGSEKYRNWLNSGSQIRDLPTVLRKLGVPQDQIRLYMDLANELHGDRNWAENLLDEFLSRYVFDMRVDQREGNFSGEERYEGDFLDEEGVDRDYSDYTVNKGQGQYEEIMFHLPFDVPGQHQGTSFQDSNLAGWIRGRGYRHSESSTFPEHPVPSVPDISVLSGIDEDTVKIDIDEDPSGDLFLKDIFVKPKDRGKGYADEALDRVLRAADFEGKTIRGWADARDEMFPEGVKDYKVGIPQEQLVEWYKRKGFVVDTDRSSPDSPNPIMVRVPQKPPQPTPAITEAPPVAPPAEAAPPAIDINEVTEYKGLPIHRVRGKPHPVHGNVAPISLSRSADGVPEYINVDMPALAESFRNKQWTSPRVSGITPLPEGAFVTFNHWAEFAAEHEFQHTNFPRIKSTESGYVENEEAINRAAAAALGITEKLYPDIPVAAPVDVWPYSPAPSVEEKLEFQSDLFEVNEVQSKLFQDNKSGFGIGSGEFALEEQRPEIDEHLRRDIEIPSDTTKSAVVETQEQAEFLNMLLKGERWASVFTKGIIQDLAKRRFKRVRFPTGDTAARVQGRETVTTALQRLKTERARRINIEAGTLPEGDDVRLDFKNLSDSETKDGDQIHYRYFKEKFPSKVWKRQTIVVMKIKNVDGTFSPYVNRVVEEEVSVEREVVIGAFHRHELKNTRSLEKIDEDLKHFGGVGSKGFNSISSFYHDRIQSILRKDRSDLKEVTDANGNTWFETEITEEDATRAISFSLQAQQPHAPRPYENTPEWMKISGRLDELPFVDYYGSYSMKVLQSYSPQLKFHVDSPAAHLHDVWWNIRNIMEGEIVIGRQYAQRMLAAAGALEAHTAIGFVYEIEGDEYVIYDLDQYKNKKFKEVARYDNLNEAIKDVHSRNKKLRRWRLPKEDRELAEDVMRWASAERENLNVIVEGVEKWTEESLEKAGFVVANEFGDLSADPALVGEKVVWFDVIEDGKTVFSSLRKGEAIEFMQEEPGTNYKFNNRYVPITRPVAEVREKFYGVHGEAEGKRRFTQVLALLDEAMEQRNRINQEMRDIAGPEWISHWEGREKDSVVVSSEYIPHLYIRKDADKEVSIAQFSGREESKRIEQRSFKNYYQAARDKGLEPVTTRADKLVESWFNDVWGAAVTRTMISLGSIMKDVNGAPLWIPQFNEGVVDKNVNKTEYETRIAMSDGFITQATENLLDYINSLRLQAGKSVFIPDRSRRGKTLINDIINKNSEYLDREGYTTMDSKFKSISHWKVKSGTGFGVSGRSGEENILRMLEERPSGHTFFKVVGRFNNWSKNVGLGLSMFHPAALYESLLAIGGFSNIKWNTMYPPRMITQITNARRRAMADPELIRKWAAAGMRVDPSNPNYDQNQIFQDLQSIKDFSSDNKIPGLGKLAGAWEGYNKWMNQWLWSEFFPGVKIYSAELLHSEMKENFADRGIEFSETALRRDIAKLVNDAFGGQNWDQYIWATPRRLQALHLMLFAPDWTTSAFNISGASNLPVIRDLVRENQGDVQKFVQVNKYWPAMAVLVMTGIPQAIQLALYSVAKLMPGDDDEEAVPFLFQNEPGKRGLFETGIGGHIDVTPVLKKLGWVPVLGYEGGVTGKRRVYMRWGKQASEVFEGWATKPWNTLANKSSSAVRTVVEQMTGYNTAGWELGFKGKPLLGLFSGEKGFTDSRIAYVGRKFVPMSILSIMDGRPTTFFAPASRGMSNYSAQTKMAELISTYASQDTWNSLHGSKEHPVNLAALGMDILEAAERNGHDSEFILTAARRQVLAHYYRQFFQAMNENNNGLLEESAHAILRINAGADDVVRSMKGRAERVRRKFGPAEEQRVREVIARVKPRGLPRPTLLTNDQ